MRIHDPRVPHGRMLEELFSRGVFFPDEFEVLELEIEYAPEEDDPALFHEYLTVRVKRVEAGPVAQGLRLVG